MTKSAGTECVVIDERSFIFETYRKRVPSNRDRFICEEDNTSITSFLDKKLQLTEKAFCNILFTCRRECDRDTDEPNDTEHHFQTALDPEDESEETGLTSI